jgi:hypothetical protein
MRITQQPQAASRKWRKWLLGLAAPALLGAGCQTAAGTGALAGGALGTGIGALAGGKNSGPAALAGGLIGAAAGGLTGAAIDANHAKKHEQAVAADTALRAPTVYDVVKMTQSGVPDSEIIGQIRTTGAVYKLTPDEIIYLNQQGVHPPVISEMQATCARPVRHVHVPPPVTVVHPVERVYVVEPPPPPPPVGLGVGIHYRR